MSTLHVENLKGLSSGGNANKIIVPSGQTLDASNGFTAPAGHVIQVTQSTLGSRPNSQSSSYVDSGLATTITPKFSTSKILVRCNFLFSQSKSPAQHQDNMKAFTIYRGSTNIAPHNSAFIYHQNEVGSGHTSDFQEQTENVALEILDSPATTSATTYSMRYKNDNPSYVTVVINGRGHGSGYEGSCIITAMEIAQ